MPAENDKPTPPVATGQQYKELYDMVNTTTDELFDYAWPAIDAKAAEPFSETFDSTDQTGTELIITHGRGRYPASVMILNATTGVAIGIMPVVTDTTVTFDFNQALTYSVRVTII